MIPSLIADGDMHLKNMAMLKIIQNNGFKQEGELLNHFLHDGNPVSAILFGRSR